MSVSLRVRSGRAIEKVSSEVNMGVRILGLGTALPKYSISQRDAFLHASELCCHNGAQKRALDKLYRRTEIGSRASVLLDEEFRAGVYDGFFSERMNSDDCGPSTLERMNRYKQEAPLLAFDSAQRAIQSSGVDPSIISHLVSASCTGFCAPGFDIDLIESLNLRRIVARTHIGFMGCHSGLNAIRTAAAFCSESPENVVLVNTTELCSLHFQYGWQSDNLVANSLFGDGSASLVMTNDRSTAGLSSLIGFEQHMSSFEDSMVVPGLRYLANRSWVFPEVKELMSWTITNSGFVMTLKPELSEFIRENLRALLSSWLSELRLDLSCIGSWCVHPGGPRILDAVENACDLPDSALEPSRQVLAECGNMSSPTIFFVLQRLLNIKARTPVLLLAFGPGLTVEAALLG